MFMNLIFLIVSLLQWLITPMKGDDKILLSVGSYTSSNQGGIKIIELNLETKKYQELYTINQKNASFQAFSQDNRLMYSVTEMGNQSSLVAYQLDESGKYQKLNELPTIGQDPCHVAIGPKGMVYTANYSGGNISVFSTYQGKLMEMKQLIQYQGNSINLERQESSHPHKITISPDKKYVFVPDLGTDIIYRHKILEDGTLDEAEIIYRAKAGSGPRHLIFHPNGNFSYLITELSGEILFFSYVNGNLNYLGKYLSDITPNPIKGSAHIGISPDWNYLLSSNRLSSDEVVVHRINNYGRLNTLKHHQVGKMPRYFCFDKTGNFLFVGSQTENYLQAYQFNTKNGELVPFGDRFQMESPVCLNQLN